MEINTEGIFERADIKQIREFITGGSITANDFHGTYRERIDKNSEDIIYALKRLAKDYPAENQLNEAINDLFLALYTYRDVYSEIGMKIGARIMFQLLFQDD